MLRYLACEAAHAGSSSTYSDTGLPTADNTHQIAQQVAPAVADRLRRQRPASSPVHARALLTSAPGGVTSYIEADVRDTEEILGEAARTLDFGQPVALMMLGIMGQLPDSRPRSIVTTLPDALPPGSYLALSDGTDYQPRAEPGDRRVQPELGQLVTFAARAGRSPASSTA